MRTLACRGIVPFCLAIVVAALAAASPAAAAEDPAPSIVASATGASIAALARANLGKGACSATSLGTHDFESSCTGNGGYPEYWCADFALWVWAYAGVTDVAGLDAAAGSFYVYGQKHGTLKSTPALGDAVVFDYAGGGVADHVAIVTQVNADGTIESVSGDWGGTGSTEAAFASTSSVVLNAPAYASKVGGAPGVIGMTISGYVAPVGLGADYGAAFVSQSFPLASTALTMVAGQSIPSFVELKNTGTKAWDSSTHLGTTQPRDRASAFADSTWLGANRPAGVTGSVAPGDSYKFTFDLHAPSKPGTYLEYFNLVQEGVAWFSDPGQGGPVDDDLEVQVVVVAAPEPADAGVADGGATSIDDAGAIAHVDAGAPGNATDDAGGGGEPPVGSTGAVSTDDDGGAAANAATSSGDGPGSSAGCAMAPGSRSGTDLFWVLGAAAGLIASRRRDRALGSLHAHAKR